MLCSGTATFPFKDTAVPLFELIAGIGFTNISVANHNELIVLKAIDT